MYDLNVLANKANSIITGECGITLGLITGIYPNSRAKFKWGSCKKVAPGVFELEISTLLLNESIPEEKVLSAVAHEMLHTARNGFNHGAPWKAYAERVMCAHPELTITRTLPAEFFGLKPAEHTRRARKRYAITCTECGMIHYSSRLSKSIQHPEWYRCARCKGKLVRVK